MDVEVVDGRTIDLAMAEEIAALDNAVAAVDAPHQEPRSAEFMLLALRHGWDDRGSEHVLTVRSREGALIGSTEVELPRWDNLRMAFAEMTIHPDYRGVGVEDATLDEVYRIMKAHERTQLVANAWRNSSLEQFWIANGLEFASEAAQRRLLPLSLDWPTLDALLADSEAHSAAYDLVEFPQPVPDDLIGDMLDLQLTMNDAPLDDLDIEDSVWTPERWREHERALAHRRMQNTCLVARHRESGEVAGYTAVVVEDERPHLGFQEDTAVVRAHRGHRLGLRLKIEMLRLLRERHPEIRQIDTWNATSNAHMIGVNEAIGCFVVGIGGELQRDLAAETSA